MAVLPQRLSEAESCALSSIQSEDVLNGAGDFSLCEWLRQRRIVHGNTALSAGQFKEMNQKSRIGSVRIKEKTDAVKLHWATSWCP